VAAAAEKPSNGDDTARKFTEKRAFVPQAPPQWFETSSSDSMSHLDPDDKPTFAAIVANLRQAFRNGDRSLLQAEIPHIQSLLEKYGGNDCKAHDTRLVCVALSDLSSFESEIEQAYESGHLGAAN
jgi:hypothetical protein